MQWLFRVLSIKTTHVGFPRKFDSNLKIRWRRRRGGGGRREENQVGPGARLVMTLTNERVCPLVGTLITTPALQSHESFNLRATTSRQPLIHHCKIFRIFPAIFQLEGR
jgi:hypothetical protein